MSTILVYWWCVKPCTIQGAWWVLNGYSERQFVIGTQGPLPTVRVEGCCSGGGGAHFSKLPECQTASVPDEWKKISRSSPPFLKFIPLLRLDKSFHLECYQLDFGVIRDRLDEDQSTVAKQSSICTYWYHIVYFSKKWVVTHWRITLFT